MGGLVFALLVVAAVVAWLWKRRSTGDGATFVPEAPGFRVAFRAGRVARIDGRIHRATLSAFEDIAAHAELSGEVRLTGIADLEFSDEIPPGVRQQLRNALITSIHVH
jgi:hypothetical protein